ncbi:4-oxalomesaconate tautomerase [Bradyrhizobium sp. INPA01-394B]|uniref:4-oxalomesaconate tautomerase n=1 Tax=Bradyrhizobium campsiandrae TaxID=1729892 RepID=A0ABR7UGX2_9BRAD|nr:4-oxalomesaconate tautomerase [Bradyrhizobium campsiandrae]MBC9879004.1 4-oxalomesaconate tautomerase [Bradyrhizobium campsiandrae]MBC9982890.1 4-oxalomesaconate tautomerase [Bradyrhizobium campsiandrae]
MDDQIAIPCVVMRGGTSRGPFFLAGDLPADPGARDAVLLSVMGGGHDLGIDGIGGGNAVTNKVAIIGPASMPGADVDYLFAQVRVREGIVDTSPNCGNMLAAVGPFAIEAGLVAATADRTRVRIHNVNTGKLIDATVSTPGGRVTYEGDARIDGVPGTAAPIELSFPDAAGARTGRLLPTGRPVDRIDGIDVTCIDAAMPVMLVRAADLGYSGREAHADFTDTRFRARLEHLRIEAGRLMGFPNPAAMVIPKPVLLAPAAEAALNTRYFMPHDCHSALAVTGAVAVATACVTSGTIAAEMVGPLAPPVPITLAHPSGQLVVRLEPGPVARVQRTARRIFQGHVFARRAHVPHSILAA